MHRDHTKFICDIGELTGPFYDAPSVDDFLKKITVMVTSHMACDACSIYLYYPDHDELVLRATYGLHPSSVGRVKMRLGQGLTGQALKEHRPICEGRSKGNPHFYYFPDIGEERFESFLAVPIMRGTIDIGVMVAQSEQLDYFTDEDIYIFRATTAQLATTIETARLLIALKEGGEKIKKRFPNGHTSFITGRSGAPGVVLAQTVLIGVQLTNLEQFISEKHHYTIDDFYRACKQSKVQLQDLQRHIETIFLDVTGMIFEAQLLMLKDEGFLEAVLVRVSKGQDAAQAVVDVLNDYAAKFEAISDSYLRDKIFDIKDVGRRILANMTGICNEHEHVKGRIVIAHDLFPSDALKLFTQKVTGIILLNGGAASHVSILARSFNVPLVVAQEEGLLSLHANETILLDGTMGYVHINPSQEIIKKVTEREDLAKNIGLLKGFVRERAVTKDGVDIKLMANINLLGDLRAAHEFKAQGVGLYRSEFPFLVRSNFPSEQEQYLIYRRLCQGMLGKPVTFRTLDIGGDKVLSYFDYDKEDNPFLGLRSIRFSLKHKDIFISQIRAILRAGYGYDIRIMFPMISSVDEFIEAKEIVAQCSDDLTAGGFDHYQAPSLGVMVELPSIVEIIDDLAQEVDFFSIGTNDLIQYLLAVDRTNERVADLYMPYHPAVLRTLKKIITAAQKFNKDISICGDMGNQPKYLPLLLGLGLRHFSMDARYLPRIYEALSMISVKQAEVLTQNILKEGKAARTLQLLEHINKYMLYR